jgi:hypothetical protein
MPPKKRTLTDAERAKRIHELAREAETSNDRKDFERAFQRIVKRPRNAPKTKAR